jgi:hypothetical protein
MRSWSLTLVVSACSPTDANTDPGTSPIDTDVTDTDTGPPPPPGLTAGCSPVYDNTLRFTCAVTVEPPQGVEVRFAPADGSGAERVHTSPAAASTHAVPLYLMRPETDYAVTVTADDPSLGEIVTTVTTGIVPLGANIAFAHEGATVTPLVGFASPCLKGAFAVVAEPATQQIVWYQNFTESEFGFLDAASFTEDGTVLVVVGGGVVEVALDGTVLLSVEATEAMPTGPTINGMHHDVFRKSGLTYAIFRETVLVGDQNHQLDGFYVFDDTGALVAEWHLKDHFTPSDATGSGPDSIPEDTSHANAVWVGDDGTILFSLRHLSAVLAIAGVDRPDFGTVLWRLSGDGGEIGSDFVLTSTTTGPVSFVHQHNAHLLPDGHLTMFDNRSLLIEPSRVLDLTIDPVAGTAVIEREYVLPEHCDYQGGAWRTPAGRPLATCAPYRDAFEFDPAKNDVWDWSLEAECVDTFASHVPRFVPLDW